MVYRAAGIKVKSAMTTVWIFTCQVAGAEGDASPAAENLEMRTRISQDGAKEGGSVSV